MIQKLIEEEQILVNGCPVRISYLVQMQDDITIEVPEVKEVGIRAQDLPIDIIYEDQDIILVNKPKGMVVHPANGGGGMESGALTGWDVGAVLGLKRPGLLQRSTGHRVSSAPWPVWLRLSKMMGWP